MEEELPCPQGDACRLQWPLGLADLCDLRRGKSTHGMQLKSMRMLAIRHTPGDRDTFRLLGK